jgi:lysophospholipase L1-like esterase
VGPSLRVGVAATVRFGGARAVTVSAGAQRWSDPVALAVRAGERLSVSVFIAGAPVVTRVDDSTDEPAWSAPGADRSAQGSGAGFAPDPAAPWRVVDGIAVAAPPGWSTLVAFGDSITAGYQDHQVAGHPTWPELLARRLDAGGPDSCRVSVVNEGISGNRLTAGGGGALSGGPSGRSRFARDALSQPGVREIVVELGTNDIAWDATHGEGGALGPIQRAERAMVAEAHARGVRVLAATVTPAGDPAHPTTFVGGYSTPAGVAGRAALNRWIKVGHAFDGVADFAAALSSAADPERLARWADSGDHLHPSTRGDQALADAVERSTISGCPDGDRGGAGR